MKLYGKAYAKINLFLDIVGTLDSGYHSLFMLMQSVDLHDTLSITSNDSGALSLSCSDTSLPTDKRNLVWRAAQTFLLSTDTKNPGMHIHIQKRIPHAAGLAGGSADAAATIRLLDRFFKTTLSVRQLCEIGLRIGSDVPFCLQGGTMLAQNTGEILSPLPALEDCHIVLAKPQQGISTQEAYQAYDQATEIHHPNTIQALDAASREDFPLLYAHCANVFEQVIEVPQRVAIKSLMRKHGAHLTQMSGSGPTIFGLFPQARSANTCLESLQKLGVACFLCRPVSQGVLLQDT